MNLALSLLALAILPYIVLAFFSVPTADDYVQSSSALTTGIMGFVIERYMTWSGRYSSDFVIAAYHVIGHKLKPFFLVDYYFIGPILSILVFSVASYLFIASIAGVQRFRLHCLFALMATAGILSHFDLKSTVFWLTGGATYTLSSAFLVLSIGVTLRIFYGEKAQSKLFLGQLLLIPFVNGLSETVMVAHTAFLCTLAGCTLIFSPSSRRHTDWLKCLLPAAAIVSAFVVYL